MDINGSAIIPSIKYNKNPASRPGNISNEESYSSSWLPLTLDQLQTEMDEAEEAAAEEEQAQQLQPSGGEEPAEKWVVSPISSLF